jgi:hypothetical protein
MDCEREKLPFTQHGVSLDPTETRDHTEAGPHRPAIPDVRGLVQKGCTRAKLINTARVCNKHITAGLLEGSRGGSEGRWGYGR